MSTMCAKTSPGITAQSELGELACRNRHMYSISVLGKSRVFGMSMNDERVLTPVSLTGFDLVYGVTGSGGGLNGGNESAIEDFLAFEGATGSFLMDSIFDLYASFNATTSLSPSLPKVSF